MGKQGLGESGGGLSRGSPAPYAGHKVFQASVNNVESYIMMVLRLDLPGTGSNMGVPGVSSARTTANPLSVYHR